MLLLCTIRDAQALNWGTVTKWLSDNAFKCILTLISHVLIVAASIVMDVFIAMMVVYTQACGGTHIFSCGASQLFTLGWLFTFLDTVFPEGCISLAVLLAYKLSEVRVLRCGAHTVLLESSLEFIVWLTQWVNTHFVKSTFSWLLRSLLLSVLVLLGDKRMCCGYYTILTAVWVEGGWHK